MIPGCLILCTLVVRSISMFFFVPAEEEKLVSVQKGYCSIDGDGH